MNSLNGSNGKEYEVILAGKSTKAALRWLFRSTDQTGTRPALRTIAGYTGDDDRTMLVTTDGFRLHAVRSYRDWKGEGVDELDFARDRRFSLGDKMPTLRSEAMPIEMKDDETFPDFLSVLPHKRPNLRPVACVSLDPALLRDTLADMSGMVLFTLYEERSYVIEEPDDENRDESEGQGAETEAPPALIVQPVELTGKLNSDTAHEAYAILMPKYVTQNHQPTVPPVWRPSIKAEPEEPEESEPADDTDMPFEDEQEAWDEYAWVDPDDYDEPDEEQGEEEALAVPA